MNERTRRRGGGHAGHTRDTAAQAIRQMPWRIPLNPDQLRVHRESTRDRDALLLPAG